MKFLHALAHALDPLHHLDPSGWFAWRQLCSPHAAMIVMALGLFCLIIGARRGVFRFVAVLLGILLGIALSTPIAAFAHGAIPMRIVEIGLPLGLGLLAGLVPQTIAFVALGSLGALVGASVVSQHEVWVGAIPGFFAAGVFGVVFSGVVETLAASAFGAVLLVGGLWQAFPRELPARLLQSEVWGPAVAAVVLTILGVALQTALHGNPEARAERRAEAREKKRRARDDRAREARFAGYTKR